MALEILTVGKDADFVVIDLAGDPVDGKAHGIGAIAGGAPLFALMMLGRRSLYPGHPYHG